MRRGAALIVAIATAVTLSAVASAATVRTLPLGSTFTVTGKTGSVPGAIRRRAVGQTRQLPDQAASARRRQRAGAADAAGQAPDRRVKRFVLGVI